MSEKEPTFELEAQRVETLRRRLEETRREIIRQVTDVEDELEEIRSSEENDAADRAQHEVLESVLVRLDDRSREELEDAEAALARLEAGTYGVCEDCGRPISPARLEAIPSARRCEHCQERFEKTGDARPTPAG